MTQPGARNWQVSAVMLCVACVLAGGNTSVMAATDPEYGPHVSINGEAVEMPTSMPIMAFGEVLTPLHDTIDAIGGEVERADGEDEYIVRMQGDVVRFTTNEQQFTVNGRERSFTILPLRVGEVLYIDTRDITEAFGGRYGWDSDTLTADLTFAGSAPAGSEDEQAAGNGPHIAVDGENMEMETSLPILAYGEIMAPLQDVATLLGGTVQRPAGQNEYVLTAGEDTIELTTNEQQFTDNGHPQDFRILPIMVGEVTYVDVRDIVTAIGGQYNYSLPTLTADIAIPDETETPSDPTDRPQEQAETEPAEDEEDVAPPDLDEATEATITGTLLYVDKEHQPPEVLLVEPADGHGPQTYTPAPDIQYVRSEQGQLRELSVTELQREDQVKLWLDDDARVLQLRVLQRHQVSGAVEFVGHGIILLDIQGQRTNFQLADDVQVTTDDDEAYSLDDLKTGDQVTVGLDETEQIAQTITLQDTDSEEPSPEEPDTEPADVPTDLSITFPQAGYTAKPDKQIRIQGEAPPATDIRVLVKYTKLFDEKVLHRLEVTADEGGQWKTDPLRLKLDLVEALIVDKFNIVAQMLDDDGNVEQTEHVTVRAK